MATLSFGNDQAPTIPTEDSGPPKSSQPAGAPEGSSAAPTIIQKAELSFDIEHVPVKDDPRAWSSLRKVCHLNLRAIFSQLIAFQNATLLLIAFASMIAALSANIQNREDVIASYATHNQRRLFRSCCPTDGG